MTHPRRSTRITGRHHYHGMVRPCAPHQYSTPSRFLPLEALPATQRPQATTAPLAARGRGTTGSHVPHRSPDQARATSMPETTWAVLGYPPGSSRTMQASPVLISPRAFRHVISGSLALAFLAHTCRAHGAAFPATLTTTALDRSSLRWFATSPRRAVAEDHQPNRPAPPSPMQHRSDRPELLLRPSSRFVFTPCTGLLPDAADSHSGQGDPGRTCVVRRNRATRVEPDHTASRLTET
jgi:hypothetical protein